jgi:hypothetical protein
MQMGAYIAKVVDSLDVSRHFPSQSVCHVELGLHLYLPIEWREADYRRIQAENSQVA